MNPPRDPTTHELVPNATRFPSGFGGLADYMHAEGVKFAVYTAESDTTCAGYPASKGYETIDANTFAAVRAALFLYRAPMPLFTVVRLCAVGCGLPEGGRMWRCSVLPHRISVDGPSFTKHRTQHYLLLQLACLLG
jgi:hypothetical protein